MQIIDNGASCHMTTHKDWYTSLHLIDNYLLVVVSNEVKCPMKGKGMITL